MQSKLRLEKWALVAEILGAAAVVISLVFVGFQIKQSNEQAALNTQALQLAAYQQLIERISDFNLTTIENPEVRIAREKLLAGAELSFDEAAVINAFLYLAYRNGDLAYLQFQQGIIDRERLLSGLGLLINVLQQPYVQAHWEGARGNFVPAYRDFIDELIDEINAGNRPSSMGTQMLLDISRRSEDESESE